jgi:hypothetical protein
VISEDQLDREASEMEKAIRRPLTIDELQDLLCFHAGIDRPRTVAEFKARARGEMRPTKKAQQ